MYLGTSKTIMTPPPGTWLAGYENGRGGDSTLDELQLRAFCFQPDEGGPASEAVCILTADLLGFGQTLTDAVRGDLQRELGFSPDAVLLAASHTHCGPQTCENMPQQGGPLVPEYIRHFRSLAVQTAAAARAALQPTELRLARGRLENYAISRRLIVEGKSHFAPSPDGPRDDEVSVILCSAPESRLPQAVLFHYTCHPTLLNAAAFSGDYPGAAARRIEEHFDGACAAFLPGCFGDIRPNATYIGGRIFRAATYRDVEIFGNALGDEVIRVAEQELASPASRTLRPRILHNASVLSLPLQNNPRKIPLTLQRIQLAEELIIVAMGGEIGVDYGHWIKRLSDETSFMPVAYSNGLVGYVCPEHQYREGGFEPYQSCESYSLPAPFSPESESLIHDAILQLIH